MQLFVGRSYLCARDAIAKCAYVQLFSVVHRAAAAAAAASKVGGGAASSAPVHTRLNNLW